MGFQAELLLLYEEQYSFMVKGKEEAVTTWKSHEAISFGGVTRLSKLVDHPEFGFPAREIAGICVAQCILSRLWPKLQKPNRLDFAPPFLIYDYFHEEPPLLSTQTREQVYLDCGGHGDQTRTKFPDKEAMKFHNKSLSLDQGQFEDYVLKRYGIVGDGLFMWETASNVATWLHEIEAADSAEWRELKKESLSIALVRAWRAYLEEIGKAGTRVLFLFH